MATQNDDAPIDVALTHYFERRDQGERIELSALVAKFPECAAELQRFFAKERQLNQRLEEIGSQSASRGPAANSPSSKSAGSQLTIRCPNCHQPTQVATDTAFTDLTCSSCGSRFGLVGQEQATTAAAPLLTMGRFELVERLGMGAFGTVWKARDKELDRTVAVKIPRQGGMTTEEQEKFLREARAAAQLSHPNIVSVHEVGRDGDSIYIVSDFVRGLTLADWLTGQQPSNREAAELCARVAEALHHAHEKGVVHRDLKPANVMLDGDLAPHIMDFGLARREVGEVTMTMDGHVLGTPAYMSPEQAEGKAHTADRRSDVYSLGVILYQLLTGELPFRGNARMLMHQVIHDEPPSPRKLNANINRDLETITVKCLEKDPAKRYQTSIEFSAELRRFLSGEPIHARPVSRIERGWRWAKRKPAVATLSAVVLALIIGTTAVLAVSNARVLSESAARAVALQGKNSALDASKKNERIAEERLEAGLIAAGDAALALGQTKARDYYREAQKLEQKLAISELPSNSGLVSSYATQPAPLIGNDGKTSNTGGFNDGSIAARSLAISPDGRTAITTGRKLTVWDIATGVPLRTFENSDGSITRVAISPDGLSVVTSGNDHTLQLWELASGRKLRTFSGHEDRVSSVAFSPDNKSISSSSIDKTVRLWDVATGNELHCYVAPTYVHEVLFTPDGRQLLAGGEWCGSILWDVESGGQIRQIPDNSSGSVVVAVALSPDGRWILAGDLGHGLILWDVPTGKKVRDFVGHTAAVNDAVFSPDGSRILSVGSDRTIRLWDVNTGKQLRSWTGHQGKGDHCAFTPDGKRALVSDRSGEVKLWSLEPEQDVLLFNGHSRRVMSLAVTDDGRTLLSGAWDGMIRLWDVATGQCLCRVRATDQTGIWGVAISHDKRIAASAHRDGTATLWDIRVGKRLRDLKGHTGVVSAAAFSPDDRTLLTTSYDSTLRLWDTSNGRCLRVFEGHSSIARAVEFSPDGRTALSAAQDNTLIHWDVASGSKIHTLKGHSHWVLSLAISSDGTKAVSGGWDHNIGVWDLASGQSSKFISGLTDPVFGVAFSPDTQSLLTGSLDGRFSMWDLNAGGERLLRQSSDGVSSIAFCRDGQTTFSGTTTGQIHRWQLDRPRKYAEFSTALAAAHPAIEENVKDADALHTYAKWYQFRGVFDWAVDFFEKARAAGASVSSLELARCYWQLGRRDDAAREFRKAIERQEAPTDYLALCLRTVGTKVDKQEAIARATDAHRQGNQKLHAGDHRAARLHYEEALDIRREVLGENHPDTATVSSDLGFVSLLLGDHSYAKECLERAIIVQKESIGTDDGRTAYTLASLCHVYRELSDFDKSMACCNEALAIRKKLFGDNRIETAWSLRDMAMLLVAMEEYSDALPYYEQAQAIQTKRLGELHRDFIVTLREYAEASEQAGHRQEAREQRKRADALEAESKSKIKSPARIREIVTRLAENGEFVQAVQQSVAGGDESFRLVIDATSDAKCLVAFEPKRPDNFKSAIIGEIRIATGDFAEAEKDLRRPLPNGRPFKHWHYMVLGRSLWGQGKHDEARKAFGQCLKTLPQKDGAVDLTQADIDHLTVAYFLDVISEEQFHARAGTASHKQCHVWYQIGQRREADGKPQEAIQAYQKCVQTACDPPHIFEAFANWRLHRLAADAKH